MAKTIVIRTPSWLERHPVQIRRLLVRLIFSEAAKYGWVIRMEHQHWADTAPPVSVVRAYAPMTDDEWAMIMGRPPS